jgi:hypothetical protein
VKSRLAVAQHKTVLGVVSALVALGIGLSVWAGTSLLPYPANAIPAPHLTFSFCKVPMWLQTQSRSVKLLGNCMGQLYAPPTQMKVTKDTVFAIGCLPGGCPLRPVLTSSASNRVESQGAHGGVYYFKAFGVGSATIWATFPNPVNCTALPSGPQPDRCPVITLDVA